MLTLDAGKDEVQHEGLNSHAIHTNYFSTSTKASVERNVLYHLR